MSEHDQQVERSATGERRRDLLRSLYLPWTWLIFLPYLAGSTALLGSVTLMVARLNQNLSFQVGTLWAWLLCRLNFTQVKVAGREHVQKGQSYIIMSNHQSHFDVLAFYGHWGWQFRWVMKQELRKVPFLGAGCASMGHIYIDRTNRQRAIASLRAARPLLNRGVSVMIFPEGTRSRDGRMKPFKKGGFMMALDWNLPILPVSIDGTRHVLPGKTLKLLPGKVRVQIHEPVDVSQYGHDRLDELMDRVASTIAQGLK